MTSYCGQGVSINSIESNKETKASNDQGTFSSLLFFGVRRRLLTVEGSDIRKRPNWQWRRRQKKSGQIDHSRHGKCEIPCR